MVKRHQKIQFGTFPQKTQAGRKLGFLTLYSKHQARDQAGQGTQTSLTERKIRRLLSRFDDKCLYGQEEVGEFNQARSHGATFLLIRIIFIRITHIRKILRIF